MYKGASKKLQRRQAVDLPHPARGYIDGPSDVRDVLPEVAALTISEARAEAAQLRVELARFEQEIAIARAAGSQEARDAAGLRKATIATRLGLVNHHLRELDEDSELRRLRAAVQEVAGDDLANRIFQRVREMRKEVLVTSETPAQERLTTKRLKR